MRNYPWHDAPLPREKRPLGYSRKHWHVGETPNGLGMSGTIGSGRKRLSSKNPQHPFEKARASRKGRPFIFGRPDLVTDLSGAGREDRKKSPERKSEEIFALVLLIAQGDQPEELEIKQRSIVKAAGYGHLLPA